MSIDTSTLDSSSEELTASPEIEASGDELVIDELLVEEISIDGMCGVY